MTPGIFATFAPSTTDSSFKIKRSLVAQCVTFTIFSSPPSSFYNFFCRNGIINCHSLLSPFLFSAFSITDSQKAVCQTVDKVGAGSYPQHHFSVNSLCFNKNLKKLQDSFILDSLISKIFASFFKFIHANVSPAFISIRAFPMY